jgi:hypothetical protein
MKFITTLAILLFTSGASFADVSATHFRIENGKIIVAQSYCGICANDNSACRVACNGAGACIQACDDQYRDCRRQNFCR